MPSQEVCACDELAVVVSSLSHWQREILAVDVCIDCCSALAQDGDQVFYVILVLLVDWMTVDEVLRWSCNSFSHHTYILFGYSFQHTTQVPQMR